MQNTDIHYVIPKGIDEPLEFIIWNARHCLIAITIVSFMMYLDELTLGVVLGILIVYVLDRFEKHSARGAAMHALWKVGIPVGLKGLQDFPAPAIRQFTE